MKRGRNDNMPPVRAVTISNAKVAAGSASLVLNNAAWGKGQACVLPLFQDAPFDAKGVRPFWPHQADLPFSYAADVGWGLGLLECPQHIRSYHLQHQIFNTGVTERLQHKWQDGHTAGTVRNNPEQLWHKDSFCSNLFLSYPLFKTGQSWW